MSEKPLSLLLMNPDGFAAVNERFGREAGDSVIREIVRRIQASHRSSDIVAKYGGVIFASVLSDTDTDGGRAVAEKVLANLRASPFLGGQLRLAFSVGVASLDPAEVRTQPHDLVRQADQALNATKRAGGGRVTVWRPGTEAEEAGNLDRLNGIFAGIMAKDYRNMVLLSDTVTMVAGPSDFRGLAAQVVEKLYVIFKLDRVGLFDWPDNERPRLIKGLAKHEVATGSTERVETLELGAKQCALLEEARKKGRALENRRSTGGAQILAFAVPLIVGDECLASLYLDGRVDSITLETSDLVFIRALAAQLAVALDRARLIEQEQRRQEREKQQLRSELEELRQALQQAKLVYRSEQMEAVLATAGRVAPTGATVLITGESGTGKELIARTLHQLSPRRKKPLVVVDCSSIPATLIESELFGHEKGAFTGAHQRKVGRLLEGDEGTVLLDEIGELPLELQSKLLRFVQEKQFTPVGGTRPHAVDVHLIAATNRDLSEEVKAGRFREDLYYRLNVVCLEVPPLRARPDDILYLANHFLETYAVLYHKGVQRFTPEAEAVLARHAWPGNVRELQNRIMQAVILCESEELGPVDLKLAEAEVETLEIDQMPRPRRPLLAAADSPQAASPLPAPSETSGDTSSPETTLWEKLRGTLARQIVAALGAGGAPPLGKWLRDDLVLEADTAARGMASRGATLLGTPETTFRRRLHKSSARVQKGLSARSTSWPEVRELLTSLVRSAELNGEDLLERTERVLLEEILS